MTAQSHDVSGPDHTFLTVNPELNGDHLMFSSSFAQGELGPAGSPGLKGARV